MEGINRGLMEEDRQAIGRFLQFVQSLMDELVHRRPDVISRRDLYPLFEHAWSRERVALRDAQEQLKSKRLDDPLERVGLTGTSLALKLGGVRLAEQQWRSGGALPGRGLRKLLDWIDTVLDSLASVLPAIEIVKEYKDCIRNEAEP